MNVTTNSDAPLPKFDGGACHLNPDGPWRRTLNEDESKRLFSQEDCHLEVFSIAVQHNGNSERQTSRIVIEEAKRFATSINETLDVEVATQIFYIYQSYTWSPFEITLSLFITLISHLKPDPTFLNIVQIFGEKSGPVEESFTAYFENLAPNLNDELQGNRKCSFELGYTIKYVERHGRTFPTDPFSIRETGVYHQWDSSMAQHNWVFLQVSDGTKTGVERLCSRLPELHQFQLHVYILLAASENWRYYTNYLEKVFSKLMDRSFYAKLTDPAYGNLDVDFSDVQKLQILTDKLHQISHILTLNINVGIQIQRFARRLKSAWLPLDFTSNWAFDECEVKMEEFLFAHRTHKGRIDSMLERSRGISGLVRTTLKFRAVNLSHEINFKNKEINENVHQITTQGVQENSLIKHLAYQSTHDTRSMKIIALITAIFLPATFVATFFGSNFFGFENGNGSAKLQIASNFWIYIVATVSLLCITISAWWWCLWASKSRRFDEEMTVNFLGIRKPAQTNFVPHSSPSWLNSPDSLRGY